VSNLIVASLRRLQASELKQQQQKKKKKKKKPVCSRSIARIAFGICYGI
jgi:predicted KAP-like P-loop ATPase